MQPPNAAPRWSADRLWWWDGARWIPAGQAPVAPPPPPPPPAPPMPQPLPPSYAYLPPAYTFAAPVEASAPGMRTFLCVLLAIATLLFGLLGLWGTIGVSGGAHGAVSIALWLAFVGVFLVSLIALIGVVRREAWGRWVAFAAGMAVSLTLLGAVLGIPIIVAAARTPTGRSA